MRELNSSFILNDLLDAIKNVLTKPFEGRGFSIPLRIIYSFKNPDMTQIPIHT